MGRNDAFKWVTGDDLDSEKALDKFPALRKLIEDQYRSSRKIEDFTLYEREDGSDDGSAKPP